MHAQVAGLESLAKIMCMEVLDLRRERDRAVASRTVTGHLRNLLGYCLSIFCILRQALCTLDSSTTAHALRSAGMLSSSWRLGQRQAIRFKLPHQCQMWHLAPSLEVNKGYMHGNH